MSEVQKKFDSECGTTIGHFEKELGRMRSGRATVGLLEGIMVDYYGSTVPLQQLGLLNAPEPRMLTIQVYDAGAVASIEKAILQADLGLNPSHDGSLIRLSIPALTEERRKELVKAVHKVAEESRISIRNHRRDAIDVLKKQAKDKEISEDDMHRQQDEIQKGTDSRIKQIDELLAAKEKEMMEV